MNAFSAFSRLVLPALLLVSLVSCRHEREEEKSFAERMQPTDHFYEQRGYPDFQFDLAAYNEALSAVSRAPVAKTATNLSLPWTLQGPQNIGGRINTVAVHPTNSQIVLAGCSAGGIFKTTNAGGTWVPVFDDKAWLAIGDIVFDPSNPTVVYAATGDPNGSGFTFLGDGLYKSTDTGNTWTYVGLNQVRILSKVVVHPTNSSILYVAGKGKTMGRDNNRGVYKTTDGGASWSQVLFVSNQSGAIDLVIHPTNPNILFASTFDHIRTNAEATLTGPNAKVWKTTDGGANWSQLTNGLPTTPLSRINLALAPSNPNVLYAAIVDTTLDLQGIYRSADAGASWTLTAMNGLDPFGLGGFGWYFANIYVNPADENDIFFCGIQFWRSQNGGADWAMNDPDWWMYEVHADKHDMAFTGPNAYYLATDGGLYHTADGGISWADVENIPNSQFYRINSSPFTPHDYWGGLQDNGTTHGNNTNINAWPRVYGGDGFTVNFDPTNANVYQVTTQNGGFAITDDGGFNFYDFTVGIDPEERRNWDAPIMNHPRAHDTYLCGTFRVFRLRGGPFGTWEPISPDLTDGVVFAERFHNVSAISVSPVDTARLYAGTSDGNVWASTNNGTTWNNVSAGLPDRYVTRVIPSPDVAGRVYTTHSGYRSDEFIPHVHVSQNDGATWTDISGDLPQLPVNDIEPFPGVDSVLCVATDGGVYITRNSGLNWVRLGVNIPVVPVYDIQFDTMNRTLIAGTHARSLYTYPMDSLVDEIAIRRPEPVAAQLRLWPNPATEYVELDPGIQAAVAVEVHDLSGRRLAGTQVQGVQRMDVSAWHAGVYLVTVQYPNGAKVTQRIVVN